MLYRVDIIHLFHRMVKGPEALEKSSSMYKDWEELTKQILRKCFKKIEDRPELIVEMLFSKMPKVIFFLEYGYEQQTIERKSHAKPAAELVFKRTEERDRQIAIAVGALLDKNQADNIAWVKGILAAAESDRTAWAAADEAMAEAMAITTEPAEGEEEPNTSVEAKQAPPFGK
jgi:replication fork protection complex subunit Tof1/Swi1